MGSRQSLILAALAAAVAAAPPAAPRLALAQAQVVQNQAAPDKPAPDQPAPDQPVRTQDSPRDDGRRGRALGQAAPDEPAASDPPEPGRDGAESMPMQPVADGDAEQAQSAQPAPAPGGSEARAQAAPDVAGDLRRLAEVLRSTNARQADRDEAAAQLASRESAAADAVLRDVLTAGGRDGRLAVARAVADDLTPPEEFIDPLASLLGAEQRALVDAAAQALAGYRRNPAAAGHLVRAANDPAQPAAARTAAVRALGRVVEPASADALVGLLRARNDVAPAALREAAAAALVEMTGLLEFGRDARRWTQWQQANAALAASAPDRWRADLLDARAARYDRLRRRHDALVTDLGPRLFLQYQSAAKEQRQAVLMDFLGSTEPDVRALGARVVTRAMTDQEEITAAVRDRLVAMVGDSDPRVRVEAADTLRNMNYGGALSALLTQLAQERDDRVKIALAGAVAPIEDAAVAATPQLLDLLNDPSPPVAVAGARALGQVGRRLRGSNPAAASAVAARLRAVVQANPRRPVPEELRLAALEALVPLRDPRMVELGRQLLREPSVPVRQAVLRALGELGNPAAAETVEDVLRNEQRDATVRWWALDALGKTGGLDFDQTFFRYMQPANEPDRAVREKAWEAFRAALPRGSDEQLTNAARLFPPRADPDRHLAVALVMAERLREQGKPNEVALQQENIGDDLMNLRIAPPRPADAAVYYEQALNYWVQNRGAALAIEELMRKVLRARLAARQYPQAATFAQSSIDRDGGSAQEVVGPVIKNEADALRKAGNDEADPARRAGHYANALALIDAALRMKPPLEKRHQDDLRDIRRDVNAAMNEGAATPPPQ